MVEWKYIAINEIQAKILWVDISKQDEEWVVHTDKLNRIKYFIPKTLAPNLSK